LRYVVDIIAPASLDIFLAGTKQEVKMCFASETRELILFFGDRESVFDKIYLNS